jgi:regulator of protease activity HflC (stomatin/prohibitin superfamily)
MLEVRCDTKTLDNVFCVVRVAVMYRVVDPRKANYLLTDEVGQIRSYVANVIRSSLPKLDIDDAFVSKDDIAKDCLSTLAKQMLDYGFEIVNVLVTDLEPDSNVKASMNMIEASKRMRVAAAEKGEAEKILQVKAAEAEADAKYLSGLGVSRQRSAIVMGLRDTVTEYTGEVTGTSANDVLDLLLVTQYFDMMKDVAHKNRQTSIFLSHEPSAVATLRADLRENFMTGEKKKT